MGITGDRPALRVSEGLRNHAVEISAANLEWMAEVMKTNTTNKM